MHFSTGSLVVGSLLIGSVQSAAVPVPVITPAPSFPTEWLETRQDVDAIDLAKVLLTAIPLSLRQIAVTNLPAVSSILWEAFLDDKKPDWFKELPLDIQSYLIVEFGPQTAWPTAPPTSIGLGNEATATTTDTAFLATTSAHASPSSGMETSSAPVFTSTSSSSESTASSLTMTSSSLTMTSLSNPGPTSDAKSPPASTSGLSRSQKIGLGIGIPLGLLVAAALLLGFCFLARRRKQRVPVDGNERPSTPGFIPRFAFHERASAEHNNEHRSPLNPAADHSSNYVESMTWQDEDDLIPMPTNRGNGRPPMMAMYGSSPIMTPALYHTHSSNRARGKRTSYTSLHSVAEVTEPDEGVMAGGQEPPRPSRRQSSLPMTAMPPIPAAATLKRKPISTSSITSTSTSASTDPSTSPTMYTPYSPDVEAASQSLLRPLLINNAAGSSSSGGISSRHTSASSELGYLTDISSPTSPLSSRPSRHAYAEDHDLGGGYQNAHVDVQGGWYGGHRSLATYPEPAPRKDSKAEWPLRNIVGIGHEKSQSPMWDRVYENHGR